MVSAGDYIELKSINENKECLPQFNYLAGVRIVKVFSELYNIGII